MESDVAQLDPGRTGASGNPMPFLGPTFAVLACGASTVVWWWFSSLKPIYLLNLVAIPVLLFGMIGHLLLEEYRKTAAVYNFRRHVPLRRSKYYVFAMLFSAAAMVSIVAHAPLYTRFALSRQAMDAFVADVQEYPDDVRPATMRVGMFVIETKPHQRHDGALMFPLAGDGEKGFTYSPTPIGYPGGNPGFSGSLGGGWYWFSDD